MTKFCFFIVCCVLLVGCQTQQAPDAYKMIQNISSHVPAIWKLLTAIAYVLGFLFFIKALINLRAHAENRGGSSSSGGVAGSLILMVVAVALIYIPTTFKVLMTTAFGHGNPLVLPTQAAYAENYRAILLIVQMIGLVSFIRGWIMITKLSTPGHQMSMGKALTHIIAGVLAVNIGGTIDMLQNTLGL